MNKLILFMALLVSTATAYSASFQATGKVALIRSFDSSVGLDWDWIGIEGLTSMGSCSLSDGYVVLMMHSDSQGNRQLSMAMAAKMAGKNIHVAIDDTLKVHSSYCLIRQLDILAD